MTTLKLYGVPGSHPTDAVEAALRLKGIPYKRRDYLPVVHKALMRPRFGGVTVPGIKLDGERMLGSRAILRKLDQIQPEPPLLPSDPDARARVEQAESWGDAVLQPLARRITWAVMRRDTKAMLTYVGDANIGLPTGLLAPGAPATAWAASKINKASDEQVQSDLRELPAHLDRIDAWVNEAVLGDPERPNVADLQIGASLRLVMTLGDIRPLIEGRPCAPLAERWFWPSPGHAPSGVLPAGWVPAAPSGTPA
jgi:glutathione S-transferase